MKRLLIILVFVLLLVIVSFIVVWFFYGQPRVDKTIASQQSPIGTVINWKPENNLLTVRFDSGLFFKDIKIIITANDSIFVSTGKQKNKLVFLPLLCVLLILVASCASFSGQQPTPGSISDVTLADNGKTIHVAIGQSFLLKLGLNYDWNITVSYQNVIGRVKNIAVIVGAQGVYAALAKGTTVLSAVGDPQCRTATPACASPSIMFSVTIVVN